MHTEPFILGDTHARNSLGFFAICGILQAKGRCFYDNTLTGRATTGLYPGEGELSFQDMVEKSQRNKTKLFRSRYLLVLAPGGRHELVVASGCNQKLRIAL